MMSATKKTRITAILELLGSEATHIDALRVSLALQALYPGVPVQNLPAGALAWLDNQVGDPPKATYTPATASSLMGLFEDLPESKQAQLLDAARTLASDDTNFADNPVPLAA